MGDSSAPGNMPDLSGLLGTLLQNPAALSMLSTLLSGNGKGNTPPPPKEPCEADSCPVSTSCLVPPPPSDNRTCLLNALRPYLSPARCNTIDSLLRILELMELLRKRR